MTEGVVKFWQESKGYGFLRRDDGQADVFCHVSAINGYASLSRDQRCRFDVVPSRDGRTCAANVELLAPVISPLRAVDHFAQPAFLRRQAT
jgi:CspA family cold shock protein